MKGVASWVEDELGGMRACVWYDFGAADLEEARLYLEADSVDSADFAVHVHPRVKWCEKYGWPCDDEGEWHEHWEFVTGEPTMTAVWDANDPALYAKRKEAKS